MRRGRPVDVSDICELHKRSVRGLNIGHYSPDQIEAWIGRREPDHYSDAMDKGEVFFVAFAADEPQYLLGFGSYWTDPAGSTMGEIRAVYVDPEVTRSGIGSLLLAALEYDISTNGVRSIHLNSSLSALPFYLYHNYQVVKETHVPVAGAPALNCISMKKDLAQRR